LRQPTANAMATKIYEERLKHPHPRDGVDETAMKVFWKQAVRCLILLVGSVVSCDWLLLTGNLWKNCIAVRKSPGHNLVMWCIEAIRNTFWNCVQWALLPMWCSIAITI
jgi:hypothetical protein